MRRNEARFALISVSKMGHQALLLRLSTVLRNAVVRCRLLITPDHCWHKMTWLAFQPSLPPGLAGWGAKAGGWATWSNVAGPGPGPAGARLVRHGSAACRASLLCVLQGLGGCNGTMGRS